MGGSTSIMCMKSLEEENDDKEVEFIKQISYENDCKIVKCTNSRRGTIREYKIEKKN